MEALLLLKKIRIENANAIAGLTWGFPAISGFLGFCHALQRKLNNKGYDDLKLGGCGIICHQHQPQAYQPSPYGDYHFALTRNPLTKEAKTPSFNEEGRMHLTVSLLIEVDDIGLLDEPETEQLQQAIQQIVLSQRLAGGTVLKLEQAELYPDAESFNQPRERRQLLKQLLPGFALVSRQDALAQHQQQSGLSPLDAWLDFASLTMRAEAINEEDEPASDSQTPDKDAHHKANWQWQARPYGGWLKPIAIGYQRISPLYQPGELAKSRDPNTPAAFVESVYSIGQWLSPHRIQDISQLLWHYHSDEDNGLYICKNAYQAPEPVSEEA
ncbi:type I-F CRISPR-associated protein Csy2 [Bacterioplanes sanyensis]|uniref:type I-F CRISPR-associated protein Csy2 n=1 Tax=Bacterioplanes sanyensis TaxID=1249553 RepID=UPI0016772685|nr:type I-F CRISPR-associated protein Csy2 [Bacterioplanes sanyensis]GGY57554.1 type I-F CRISPR-associated protein Csy2 [Bacterioplanes sanyensis]